jgi:DNA-binding transcriptional LysR family regulator
LRNRKRTFQYRIAVYIISQADRSGLRKYDQHTKKGLAVTLDQLRVFVAVAERQHVTEAARALNLAQSAASSAIATLEARHGTKLFNRIGRNIELTEAGRAFLQEARAVLARAEAAELALVEFSNLKRGVLSVQASQTIAGYWLPRHLAAFRQAYPLIDIRLSIGNTAQVVAAIENGSSELGFVEGACHSEHLIRTPIARDQLIVVVAPEHELATRKRLTPADLPKIDWVLRERGSGTRSVFEDALVQFGVATDALRISLELPSNEAVRAAVEAGLGATAISASVAVASLESGLLQKVDFRLPEREFHVLTHRERDASRAAQAFLGMLNAARGAKHTKRTP